MGNRPERTVYRLTDDGRREFFLRMNNLLSTPGGEHGGFSAAMSFIAHLDPHSAAETLRLRAVALEGRIARLAAEAEPAEQHVQRVSLLESEHLLTVSRAELDWIRGVIADLRCRPCRSISVTSRSAPGGGRPGRGPRRSGRCL
ncbi:hypothetical protein AB0J35_13255 [Nonomuraea angiospora]|uniref:hypothetical protein n=1 Tax=Nonomuraea angiospora TaxID=46172 RepID=UPI00342E244A